jgi:hypothetical protein
MRIRKAFLSCAVVAALGLSTAETAMAKGGHHGDGYPPPPPPPTCSSTPTPAPPAPPTSCSTGMFTVTVTSGPSFVSCSSPSGQCTEIEYTVTGGTPDQVDAAEGVGVQYVDGPGGGWFPPCVGDQATDFAEKSCHEQVAKFNPSYSVQKFKIGLDGQRSSGPTTVVTKKGSTIGSCRIVGIGLDGVAAQFASTQTTETVVFEGCAVDFVRDAATGAVSSATFNPAKSTKLACSAAGSDPSNCCSDLTTKNVDKLKLELDGEDLGSGQIGDGYVSSGSHSCTTRIIGGRVYTWGSPCP